MREKLIESARSLGLEVEVRRLDASTATVQEAAGAVGCDDAQIAKSLVFVADGDPVVCIASGAHRVDPDRLADVLDVAEVRQATPEEVRAATGFRVGGVPPFGHGLPVVFDQTLLVTSWSGRRAATATACSRSTRRAWWPAPRARSPPRRRLSALLHTYKRRGESCTPGGDSARPRSPTGSGAISIDEGARSCEAGDRHRPPGEGERRCSRPSTGPRCAAVSMSRVQGRGGELDRVETYRRHDGEDRALGQGAVRDRESPTPSCRRRIDALARAPGPGEDVTAVFVVPLEHAVRIRTGETATARVAGRRMTKVLNIADHQIDTGDHA